MIHRFSIFSALGVCCVFLNGCASNNASSPSASQGAPIASKANTLTPTGTTNFTSKEAKFSIYFPGKVMPSKTSGSAPWGKYQLYTFASKGTSASYVVLATTIPSGVDTSDSTHFIDGVQKGLLKSSNATVDKSREITLNGTPGRELYTTLKAGGNTGKSRVFIFVTPAMSYQVMGLGLDGEFQAKQTQAQVEKVFSSFRLIQ